MDILDYLNKDLNYIENKVYNKPTGSYLNEVLGFTDKFEGYNNLRKEEAEALTMLKKSFDNGEVDFANSVAATFNSSLTKAYSERYATRKALFKVGYDKKIANNIYSTFIKNTADALTEKR